MRVCGCTHKWPDTEGPEKDLEVESLDESFCQLCHYHPWEIDIPDDDHFDDGVVGD